MDLNHIDLPASLLTDLYKTHLIESVSGKPAVIAPVQNIAGNKNMQYLGKNKKRICLLVSYANDVYLPDDQLDFLTTILQACRLKLGDVAIINHAREKISFSEIRQQLACNYLVIFGVDPATIGLGEIPEFSLKHIDDCAVVYSPPAEQLNNNSEGKLLKGKLWSCLKQLFNV